MNKIRSLNRIMATIMAGCLLTAGSLFAVNLSHFHTPRYNEGKLIPWYSDEAGPFEHIMDIEAKWWRNCPEVNGWPVYITAAELTRDCVQRNGATIGTTNALGIIAYLKYYAYTGD
jgi:hypothetical protein